MTLRTKARTRRGATAVEMVFVIVLALLFMFGIFEYGRFLMVRHLATNAAREGARYASVNTGNGTTPQNIKDVVTARMAGRQTDLVGYNVDVFAVNMNLIYDPATGQTVANPQIQPLTGANWNDSQFGGGIAVRVTGNYKPVLPTFLFMNSTIPVQATAVMGSEAN
jgi:Flp pilus assembly protein TadG